MFFAWAAEVMDVFIPAAVTLIFMALAEALGIHQPQKVWP
jgi:hypothetical protein